MAVDYCCRIQGVSFTKATAFVLKDKHWLTTLSTLPKLQMMIPHAWRERLCWHFVLAALIPIVQYVHYLTEFKSTWSILF